VAKEVPAPAAAAGPVTLAVYDPTGVIEVTQLFAPRLADLNGKTICDLSDNMWQVARTFPLIDQMLQKQFPTAKIIPYTEFPSGTADNDTAVNLMKQKGCQAVIVGNAG
jgi:hypothetical protein